ncbi:MAG: hypothetical protein U9R60_07595 [Bacteroidota bacterium]|nr:hypothetical protein [Bacteroidota bacterium]
MELTLVILKIHLVEGISDPVYLPVQASIVLVLTRLYAGYAIYRVESNPLKRPENESTPVGSFSGAVISLLILPLCVSPEGEIFR